MNAIRSFLRSLRPRAPYIGKRRQAAPNSNADYRHSYDSPKDAA